MRYARDLRFRARRIHVYFDIFIPELVQFRFNFTDRPRSIIFCFNARFNRFSAACQFSSPLPA
nr:MAG TPA: hypothetical protein [Caudoviricetes sp.]